MWPSISYFKMNFHAINLTHVIREKLRCPMDFHHSHIILRTLKVRSINTFTDSFRKFRWLPAFYEGCFDYNSLTGLSDPDLTDLLYLWSSSGVRKSGQGILTVSIITVAIDIYFRTEKQTSLKMIRWREREVFLPRYCEVFWQRKGEVMNQVNPYEYLNLTTLFF